LAFEYLAVRRFMRSILRELFFVAAYFCGERVQCDAHVLDLEASLPLVEVSRATFSFRIVRLYTFKDAAVSSSNFGGCRSNTARRRW